MANLSMHPALRDRAESPLKSLLATVLGLSLGAATALGLARFAYAVILPSMRADLNWTYWQSGAMNTANALGYLLGSMTAQTAIKRFGGRAAFVASIGVTALALLASGSTRDYAALMLLRLLAGVSGAWTFVAGGGMAATLAAQHGKSWINGLYYGGAGIGIALSASVLPLWLAESPAGWPSAWLTLGALACAFWGIATLALRRIAPTGSNVSSGALAISLRPLLPAFAAYLCFALGYIGYMTFIIALLRGAGASIGLLTSFWVVLGAAAIGAPFVVGRFIERRADGRAMAVIMGLLVCAALLPLASAHPVVVLASGALFGAMFLSVVSSVTTLVRKALPSASWVRGIAVATIVFAVGQSVGPLATGALSDVAGGLEIGLAASALTLLLGAGIALMQRTTNAARAS